MPLVRSRRRGVRNLLTALALIVSIHCCVQVSSSKDTVLMKTSLRGNHTTSAAKAVRIGKASCFLTYANIGKYGRLGNQIFQLASTIGIAESNKMPWKLPSTITNASIGQLFDLHGDLYDVNDDLEEYKEQQELFYDVRLPACKGAGISLSGYFQSLKYFASSLTTLERVLRLRRAHIKHVTLHVPDVLRTHSVTMHVRRGDYVGLSDLYSLPGVEFYRRALATLREVDVVIVVSDDIEW